VEHRLGCDRRTGADVTVVFDFASPIDSFGAYLTGTETGIDGTFAVSFNDGSVVSLPIGENPGTGGGVQFFGFTDAGKLITSITITEAGPFNSRDVWGIDDIRVGIAAVPEPTSLLLLGSGLCGLAAVQRLRR
jgi:hypothetical protein